MKATIRLNEPELGVVATCQQLNSTLDYVFLCELLSSSTNISIPRVKKLSKNINIPKNRTSSILL
uniref:Uncharacterized protein n=1 Tax=Arundo donax TaxID=35708 RepID=A0A0A9GUC8_ARUDO